MGRQLRRTPRLIGDPVDGFVTRCWATQPCCDDARRNASHCPVATYRRRSCGPHAMHECTLVAVIGPEYTEAPTCFP